MIVPVVKIRRLRQNVAMPRYHSEQAAGLDLAADLDEPIVLEPLARAAVATGIAVEIPAGFEGQVRARSGRALSEGLALVNSPGTIDADYRGEIRVITVNLGSAPITLKHGDRIAQLIIAPVARAEILEVETLQATERGRGGFGHSGR